MKKVLAAIVAALVVATLGWTHRDQVVARTSCADKIAHQYTTSQVVPGAYDCLNPEVQYALAAFYDVKNAKELAAAIGYDGATYNYVGETKDGGYTYEVDYPTAKRSFKDEMAAVWSNLMNGDVSGAWTQLNDGTELWASGVFTVYLFPPGVNYRASDGTVIDLTGKIEVIQ